MLWMSTGTRQGAGSSHPHSSRQVEATPQPQRACLGLAPSHTGRARELSWGQRSNLGSFVIPSHKSMLLLPKPRVVVGEGSHRLLGTRWSPPPSPAPPSLANSQPPAPRRAVLHPDGSEFSHHCCPGPCRPLPGTFIHPLVHSPAISEHLLGATHGTSPDSGSLSPSFRPAGETDNKHVQKEIITDWEQC